MRHFGGSNADSDASLPRPKPGSPGSHPRAAPFGTRPDGVVRARPARHDALNGSFRPAGHFSSLCGRGSRPIATASGTSRKENGPAAAARCVPAPGAVSGRRVKFSDRGGPVLSAAGGRIFRGRPLKSPPNAFSRTHALRGDGYGTGRHLEASGHWSGVVHAYLEGDLGRMNTILPCQTLPSRSPGPQRSPGADSAVSASQPPRLRVGGRRNGAEIEFWHPTTSLGPAPSLYQHGGLPPPRVVAGP